MDHVVKWCVTVLFVCAVTCGQEFVTTTEYYANDENVTDVQRKNKTVPSKPLHLAVHGITSDAIHLHWKKPDHENGIIEGYRVYYLTDNYTDVQSLKVHNGAKEPNINYNLTHLKSNSEYKVWVKAFTGKNEGDSSDAAVNRTDINGPSAPRIVNLTCISQDSLFLHWRRPNTYQNSIDYYYVNYTSDTLNDKITVPTTKEHLDTSFSIKNLTTNTIYEVTVSAASKSSYTGRLIHGETSKAKKVLVQANCDKINLYERRTTSQLSAGMIAGLICAAFAFLLAVTAFILWRKCFHAAYYYLDDPPSSLPTTAIDWNAAPQSDGEHKGAILVRSFIRHVAQLHADGDIAFSKEYEIIQAEANTVDFTSEHSQQPENRPKNRYLNIIAYDHSRVQLLAMPGQKKNIDYVNANYIDGFQRYRAYIGTQGPLPTSFDCFWRMVWEQRVNIIVMITNLVERGRRKCDMYWPKEGMETYGVIQVKLVKEDVMATYTVRTLLIHHLKIKKKKATMAEKIVYQYHYTNWPDHGTPDHPLPVLHFVKKSSAANPVEAGPIVVHCSAGVGRTGTYIVIDAMLHQIRTRGEVNIFGFLRHIRTQRNFLVQTEEQYIFIHDALLEAIESGETNISREHIPKYVQVLQTVNINENNEPWKVLDAQFKLVTSFQCKEFNLVSANKVINQPKNRSMDILPMETSRVHLTPKPGEDGSDYINATWIQGFSSLKEFIITQHPLPNTVKDFWQMVWDHNVQTIVMLGVIDHQDYEIFWPSEQETIEAETYRLKLVNEHAVSTYVSRDFTMQSLQDDYELHVRMVHGIDWPHSCSSISDIFHLSNTIVDTQLGYHNGPLVVMDRLGGPEAATFCCLNALKKHLAYENHADVYMYAKLYHNKRPGVWSSADDYLRLHLSLQALCSPPEDTPDLYAMANGTANGSVSNERIRIPPEGMETASSRLSIV